MLLSLRLSLLLSLLILVSGCSLFGLSHDAELALATDRTSYVADDQVTLRLVNRTSRTALYNLCSTKLERRSEGEWNEVPTQRVCTAELRHADPGTEASATFSVAGYFDGVEFRSGTYRLSTDVWVDDVKRPLRTGAFTITE